MNGKFTTTAKRFPLTLCSAHVSVVKATLLLLAEGVNTILMKVNEAAFRPEERVQGVTTSPDGD